MKSPRTSEEVKGVEDGSTGELLFLAVGRRRGLMWRKCDSLYQPQTRKILLEGKNTSLDVVARGGLHPPASGREMEALDFSFDSADLLLDLIFVHIVFCGGVDSARL